MLTDEAEVLVLVCEDDADVTVPWSIDEEPLLEYDMVADKVEMVLCSLSTRHAPLMSVALRVITKVL